MRSNLVLLGLLTLSLVFSGCGSSFMTQSQTITDSKKSYSKILVVSRGSNEIARSLLEQDIARELGKHGVNAVAYHKASGIGIPVDIELTDAQYQDLERQVEEGGYDGAIITHLVNVEEYKDLIPPGLYPSTTAQNFGQFAFYWGFYRVYDIAPGGSVEGVRFELESALYDLRGTSSNSLQWLGRFKLDDPEDIQKATSQYGKELVNAMMKESISKG